jgi:tRNA-2-methylthio-N6-dimethylallyladenosine synthase
VVSLAFSPENSPSGSAEHALTAPPAEGTAVAVAGRYVVETFGCQMNMHDSDRMEEVLVRHGWVRAPSVLEADLIVFNTCSVREKAEQKLRSEVGKLAPLKEANPELVIAVAGCVAQQEGEKLLERVPHLDLVLGPDNLAELPRLAADQRAGALPLARTVFDVDAPSFLGAEPGLAARAPVSAFVTTMKGCDERCSFCIVPYTRGPERYRPAQDIVDEVRRWTLAGAREVVLLGQTVDSYRDPSLAPLSSEDPDETHFPHLLRLLAGCVPRFDPTKPEAPGLARLRYTSPHPRHATASLALAHAELDLLARHVHMPVQSGSDRMLRRMIRRYTRAEYIARMTRLKSARPGLTLSTDIIVGFPGETEADFAETLSLVREMGFVSLFGFKFSPRPHTPALRLADDVTEEEKSERLARLFEAAEENGRAHLTSLVGTTQEVLVEGPSKAAGDVRRMTGRTERNEIVHVEVPDGRDATGSIVRVDVVRAFKHSLEGRLESGGWERLPRQCVAPPERRALPVVA